MHTDDHILEALVAANAPLPAIAAELKMSFIALVRWMDAHADLIATAKRALKRHIKLLSLRAEAAAIIDLTSVSSTTTHEDRKRKSASQLLRHAAKRLPLTNAMRKRARSVSHGSSARSVRELAGSDPHAASSPSPRDGGEKCLREAKAMRGGPIAPSINESCATNPERKLRAPCASASPSDLLHQLAASDFKATPSTPPSPNAQWRMPNAASLPNAASSLRASCGSAPALHQPDIVTQAVVAGLHMGMRIPGFTLADCAPPETS